MTVILTDKDHAEIQVAPPLKVPAKTGIKAHTRYSLRVKVGGEMRLVSVVCRCEPYEKKLKNGGTAWYVDVFGWGVRKSVNIKKLREAPKGIEGEKI